MRMTNHHAVTAVGIAAVLTIALTGMAPTSTEPDPLAAVQSATPDTIGGAASVPTTASGDDAISATVAGTDVTIPVDPSSGISLGTGAGDIAVSLPYASAADDAAVEKNGVISYDNNNGSVSVPVVTADGTLQINTVISSASAPQQYSYELTIPDEGRIVPAGSRYFIVNAEGDPVTYVAAPWARDANGADVPTRFELNGTTITQVVGFTSDTAFPVVADPQFVWYGLLPSVQLTRGETKTATTMTGMATVCGWVTRLTGYAGGALCGLNAASIIVNSQRIYYAEKRCAQLLIGPGVIGTIGYSGGYCR